MLYQHGQVLCSLLCTVVDPGDHTFKHLNSNTVTVQYRSYNYSTDLFLTRYSNTITGYELGHLLRSEAIELITLQYLGSISISIMYSTVQSSVPQ